MIVDLAAPPAQLPRASDTAQLFGQRPMVARIAKI